MKMHIDELRALMVQGMPTGEVVLDVRDEDEFAEGHIPGALNVPHDRVQEKADELRKYRRVYIHCGGGGRAGKAFAALEALGLTHLVHICESGMRHWQAKGYPIEK